MIAPQPARMVRFGVFDMDVETGELWNGGHRTRLQEQPRQVLLMLVMRPGEVVTRDALRAALWPDDTFVDFDASLNVAINKVRHVLHDSATAPRFIETLPRRGYRFIAPVVPARANQPSAPATKRRGAAWPIAGGAMLLAVVAGAAVVSLVRADRSPQPLRPTPLTTMVGLEYSPAISPDGSRVSFLRASGDRWDPKPSVYVQSFGAPHPSKLTLEDGFPIKPAWSPDGRYLAFLRHPDPGNWSLHDIVVVPAAGGAERRIGGASGERHGLSWSPDGRSLAIIDKPSPTEPDAVFLMSTDNGAKQRVTSPPDAAGDCSPVFSPDGRSLAFLREKSLFRADVHVVDLAQRTSTRVIADKGLCTGGLDWTSDGASLVFASQSDMGAGGFRLWTIAATGGRPQDLGVDGLEPSTSRGSRRLLLFTRFLIDWNAWRVSGPLGPVAEAAPRRLIDSTRLDFSASYSPDGTRIAFVSQRSGATEVWAADSDGGDPRRLTFLDRDDIARQLAWSPDSREVVFTSPVDGTHDIYLIAAEGGLPERVTATPADERFPTFSRDGRWIYYSSRSSGVDQIWKVPRAGGPPVQVTKHGGVDAHESPDGRFLYLAKASYTAGRSGIWRMALPDGAEEKIAEHGDAGRFDVYQRGVCYMNVGADLSAAVECLDVATKLVRKLATFEKQPLPAGFSISPDGQWILVTRVDRSESDLMMIENFR